MTSLLLAMTSLTTKSHGLSKFTKRQICLLIRLRLLQAPLAGQNESFPRLKFIVFIYVSTP